MVSDPVDHGSSDVVVAEHFVPAAEGLVAGDDIFGYSPMLGGYPGGQAEYARVPFADVGPIKIEDGILGEQVNTESASEHLAEAQSILEKCPGPGYLLADPPHAQTSTPDLDSQ
ncbi:MAG: hypothetical protein ACRDRR_05955 [Pseudonocardiaceae bacterium]